MKLIDDIEVLDWSKTASCNPNSYSQQLSPIRKPLVFPEELGTLNDVIILHRKGTRRIQKVPYFSQDFVNYFKNVNSFKIPPPSPVYADGWTY